MSNGKSGKNETGEKNDTVVKCLRHYRKAVGAYADLIARLDAVHRQAADGQPMLPLTRRHLEEAAGALDCIGEGLSFLPELAGCSKRRCASAPC